MGRITSELVLSLVERVTRPAQKVSEALGGIKRQVSGIAGINPTARITQAAEANNRALAKTRGQLVDAAAGFFAIKAAIGGPVRAARDFESAMADVRKVVDEFGDDAPGGQEAFAKFGKELSELSHRIPLTTQELAGIAAAAGEAGFAADELLDVTEAAAKIAVAFGSSAEETGAMLAAMQRSYGMSAEEAMTLSDAMNHLSNNMASSAPKLMDFWTRTAADAERAGFTQQQAVAIGSAMIAAGNGSDVAATSFRNMVKALQRGESATKRQRAAYQQLGLEASDVAIGMQQDAVATTRDVLQRLASLPAEVQASVTSDLFGDEARALGVIAGKLDVFDDALSKVADETQYAGSAFREFEQRSATSEGALQTFMNWIEGLKIAIGNALLPQLGEMQDALIPLIERLTEFVDLHPDLIANVASATAGLVAFKAAVIGLRFVGLLGKGGALSLMAAGMGAIGKATKGPIRAGTEMVRLQKTLAGFDGKTLTGLQKVGAAARGMLLAVPGVGALSGVMSALAGAAAAVVSAIAGITAPVWLSIAAGAAAVAAVGTWVWRKWDAISATFRGVSRAVGEALAPALQHLEPVIDALSLPIDAVIGSFRVLSGAGSWVVDGITSAFAGFTGWIGGFFEREILTEDQKAATEQRAYEMVQRIISAIKTSVSGIYQAGVDLIDSFWNGMKDRFASLIEWVKGIPGRIKDSIGNIDLSSAVSFSRPKWLGGSGPEVDGARAEGGPIRSGKTYLTGERGAEIITPERDGWVTNNRDLINGLRDRARAVSDYLSAGAPSPQSGGGGRSVTIHMAPVTIHGVQDIRGSAQEIARIMQDELRQGLAGAFTD